MILLDWKIFKARGIQTYYIETADNCKHYWWTIGCSKKGKNISYVWTELFYPMVKSRAQRNQIEPPFQNVDEVYEISSLLNTR